MLKTRLRAMICGAAMAAFVAYAQTAARRTAAAAPARGAAAGGNTANPIGGGPVGGGIKAAPAPQYWIADADIFIGNAAHTAQVMEAEQKLSVLAPGIIGNQANFMANAIQRAYQDVEALDQNARQALPNAVPNIRGASAELVAAEAQARQLSAAANSGKLGPTYTVTVRSTLAHLQGSLNYLNGAAHYYPGATLTSSAFFGGGEQ